MWEFVSSHGRDGDEVLETVSERVRNGCAGGITGSEGELSLDGNGLLELIKNRVGSELKDGGIEDATILKDLLDVHLISERIDLQFIEKGSLGGINLLTGDDDLLVSNNFDLGLNNLGLDLEGLEERGLLWIKTSWSLWDGYIIWGEHTGLGWRWSNLIVEDALDITEISVGENDVSVTLELGDDLFDVGAEFPGALSLLVVVISLFWLGVSFGKGGLHEGL